MQATVRLYEEDSSLCDFEAEVLACEPAADGYNVTLDRTAFYPEGGGQPADRGVLGGAAVRDVREKDGLVLHRTDAPLEPGRRVAGQVDPERRLDFTQQHSAEHMVSGIVHSLFGYDNVGFHLTESNVSVDFNGELSAFDLERVEEATNRAVWDDLPTRILRPTAAELGGMQYRSKRALEGAVRIVQVGGVDSCACCGTHVARAGQVGLVRIAGAQRHKGGCRLSLLAGGRALADYRGRAGQTDAIGHLLSVKPLETAEAVRRALEQSRTLEYELNQARLALFRQRAAGLAVSAGPLCLFEEGLPADLLRLFALALCEGREGACGVFSPDARGGHRYAAAVLPGGKDLRPCGKALHGRLGGGGGGSETLLQGSVPVADPDAIQRAFFELF